MLAPAGKKKNPSPLGKVSAQRRIGGRAVAAANRAHRFSGGVRHHTEYALAAFIHAVWPPANRLLFQCLRHTLRRAVSDASALNTHVGVWGLCPQPLHVRQPVSGYTAGVAGGGWLPEPPLAGRSPEEGEEPSFWRGRSIRRARSPAFPPVPEGNAPPPFAAQGGNAVVKRPQGRFTTMRFVREDKKNIVSRGGYQV